MGKQWMYGKLLLRRVFFEGDFRGACLQKKE